jgi:molybdopterin converting factor small subunit
LTALEQRYDDNLVGLSAYYAERTRLQTQSVDAELQAKRQELVALEAEESQLRAGGQDNTGNVEARARLLTEIVKLERDRAEIGVTAAREQAAAERELADQLLQVRARLAEATGQTAEARRQQIEAEFAELRSSLEASGNAAGVELVDRLINVESAKANLDELQTSITDTLQNLRAQEDNITAQIDAGIIGQVRGEEDLQNLRERSIEQLQRYRVALEAAYAAAKDPAIQAEIQKRLTDLDTELARVTASTQQLRNQLRDIGQNGLEGFFRDITSGTKSIGDAFKGLISSIAGDIAALASRNVAEAIVGQISGAFGGGGGNFLGSIGTFFSSFFHRGGIVGQGAQIQRAVPAWAFAGAPRFHSGGVAGLKPDEVPAVLQRGEEVLAKNDPRNAANGQQGGFRVVNVVDPKMAADYLESSEGERVIMNIIGRNPGQVRQLLG